MRVSAVRFLAFLLPTVACGGDGRVAFSRDIRPLLEEHCFRCHDGLNRKGGFSFLFQEEVFGLGESGRRIVVPGKPDESELIARLRSPDPDERMPPVKGSMEGLDAREIGLLERWIREGARWEQPWHLQPPRDEMLPHCESRWPRADLDRFVLSRMEEKGLRPSPDAPDSEWLRRVSLDLTGLPPSLDDWQAFRRRARTDAEGARESAVDRLLQSPHFGERWATVWLDLARYADSTGFDRDPHRDIWPYRDWVIRSFNRDIPFDRFTTKQIAGDLAADPEPFDAVASAFHRNTRTNTEPGSDDEEFRVAAVLDRVNTTWTAWMGTTFACAQCHDHPSEPVRQIDYFRFMAFFDQTEDCDLNDDFPRSKVAEDPGRQGEVEELERSVKALRTGINAHARGVAEAIREWRIFSSPMRAGGSEGFSIRQGEDGWLSVSGTVPTHSTYTLSGPVDDFSVLRLEILPVGTAGAVVSKLEAEIVRTDGLRRPVVFREVVADFLAGPFDPGESLNGGPEGFGDYPSAHGSRTAWFVPEAPVDASIGDKIEIRLHHGATCNGNERSCVLRRFRISLSDDGSLLSHLASDPWSERRTELLTLVKRHEEIAGVSLPVMFDREEAAHRQTRLFVRGSRETKTEMVNPGIPRSFGGGGGGGHGDRRDVAEWLSSDANPLAGRVMVNRIWAELFGTGIVENQEDFGGGPPPLHRELLDHLVIRLRDGHGWRLKPFLRELVLSSTYRQSSRLESELASLDPSNRMLTRVPRRRLTAEMIRDQSLVVSGLLDDTLFGPPVFPFQPDGIWRTANNDADWINSTDSDRNRRAIYTYRKRTSGYPALLIFDAPDRDVCSPRRNPTNTPLQALVGMNDPFHIEVSKGFAARLAGAGNEPERRIAFAWELLFLEAPSPDSVGVLMRLYREALSNYLRNPHEARQLAGEAESAAWVVVASALLNSDSALTR